MADDELFELRNFFLVGNYQGAINEGAVIDPASPEQKLERDVLTYRSYVAKGDYSVPIEEIDDDAPPALQAVKGLARFCANPDDTSSAESLISEWMGNPSYTGDQTVLTIAATLQYSLGHIGEVMKLMNSSTSLEGRSLLVQAFLEYDRVDLAIKEISKLQAMDDMATSTQLAAAWVMLHQGGSKVKDALDAFQELAEKWNATPLLLNGIAACFMKLGQFSDAETALREALEKDSKNGDTLANMVAVGTLLHSSEDRIKRHRRALLSRCKTHPLAVREQTADEAFDRAAAMFRASVAS